MATKNVYINPSETPLKYFKFLKVTLLIGLVIRIVQAVGLFGSDPTWYDIAYAIAGFALTLAAVVGMNAMKWYGILSFLGIYLLTIVDAIVAIALILICGLTYPSIATVIGRILGCLIILIPSWIYFSKRRMLFDPTPQSAKFVAGTPSNPSFNDSSTQIIGKASSPKPTSESVVCGAIPTPPSQVLPRIQFCRKCGARLLDDSKYCSYCGTAIVEDPNNVLP